jgi:hypothetical protein
MDERQTKMWDALCSMTGEEVLNTLTDYHGLQLLDEGFYEHLQDEGILEEDVEIFECPICGCEYNTEDEADECCDWNKEDEDSNEEEKEDIVSDINKEINNNTQVFPLGQLVMTRTISDTIADNTQFAQDVTVAFERYKNADWDEGEPLEDRKMNDEAIKSNDDRVFASYPTCKGKIWIITEWDRSVTTILFPEEY